ncbi:F0F1 ATP synthase subunit epsilon [Enemella sp. A6]|uniref:F0F1 ATP synthase subunit epsilon n=1 Tax=Enemella sp. A6 TaxID=3440152 RepID=UPI003EB72AF5
MTNSPLHVEVVSAEKVVWSGESINIIARTVEGDIGILPGHSPLLAVLVPCGVEILNPDGRREIIAVDGGFISVAHGRVSILSQYARLGQEISLAEAERELAEATRHLENDQDDEETRRRYNRASAQVKAAQKIA